MCDCSFGSHLNYSVNLAVSRSSNSLRKPDREFGLASEELRRQKVPSAPEESRSHQVQQHLHDNLSVIQDPRYEFMNVGTDIGTTGKSKQKKKNPTALPRGGAEAGHDLGGGRPWTLTWRGSTFLCALSIPQQQSALSAESLLLTSPPHHVPSSCPQLL